MHEVYLVLTGITFGSVFTLIGGYLGACLVRNTYLQLTEPATVNTEDNSRGLPDETEAYDWDSYDQYVKGAKDDDDEVPKA